MCRSIGARNVTWTDGTDAEILEDRSLGSETLNPPSAVRTLVREIFRAYGPFHLLRYTPPNKIARCPCSDETKSLKNQKTIDFISIKIGCGTGRLATTVRMAGKIQGGLLSKSSVKVNVTTVVSIISLYVCHRRLQGRGDGCPPLPLGHQQLRGCPRKSQHCSENLCLPPTKKLTASRRAVEEGLPGSMAWGLWYRYGGDGVDHRG